MDLALGTRTASAVVDVSGLTLSGIELLPTAGHSVRCVLDGTAAVVDGRDVEGTTDVDGTTGGRGRLVELDVLVAFLASLERTELASDYPVLELVAAWHAVAAAVAGQELAAMANPPCPASVTRRRAGCPGGGVRPGRRPGGDRRPGGAGPGRHDHPHRAR